MSRNVSQFPTVAIPHSLNSPRWAPHRVILASLLYEFRFCKDRFVAAVFCSFEWYQTHCDFIAGMHQIFVKSEKNSYFKGIKKEHLENLNKKKQLIEDEYGEELKLEREFNIGAYDIIFMNSTNTLYSGEISPLAPVIDAEATTYIKASVSISIFFIRSSEV